MKSPILSEKRSSSFFKKCSIYHIFFSMSAAIIKNEYIKMCYLSQMRILIYVDNYMSFGHLKILNEKQ